MEEKLKKTEKYFNKIKVSIWVIININTYYTYPVKQMESVVDNIPVSLYEELSKNLVDSILDNEKKDAVPTDVAKKIIYLWRQDQLKTPAGIKTLIEASLTANPEETYQVLNQLGLEETIISLRAIQ